MTELMEKPTRGDGTSGLCPEHHRRLSFRSEGTRRVLRETPGRNRPGGGRGLSAVSEEIQELHCLHEKPDNVRPEILLQRNAEKGRHGPSSSPEKTAKETARDTEHGRSRQAFAGPVQHQAPRASEDGVFGRPQGERTAGFEAGAHRQRKNAHKGGTGQGHSYLEAIALPRISSRWAATCAKSRCCSATSRSRPP